jgi:hypothetical protein
MRRNRSDDSANSASAADRGPRSYASGGVGLGSRSGGAEPDAEHALEADEDDAALPLDDEAALPLEDDDAAADRKEAGGICDEVDAADFDADMLDIIEDDKDEDDGDDSADGCAGELEGKNDAAQWSSTHGGGMNTSAAASGAAAGFDPQHAESTPRKRRASTTVVGQNVPVTPAVTSDGAADDVHSTAAQYVGAQLSTPVEAGAESLRSWRHRKAPRLDLDAVPSSAATPPVMLHQSYVAAVLSAKASAADPISSLVAHPAAGAAMMPQRPAPVASSGEQTFRSADRDELSARPQLALLPLTLTGGLESRPAALAPLPTYDSTDVAAVAAAASSGAAPRVTLTGRWQLKHEALLRQAAEVAEAAQRAAALEGQVEAARRACAAASAAGALAASAAAAAAKDAAAKQRRVDELVSALEAAQRAVQEATKESQAADREQQACQRDSSNAATRLASLEADLAALQDVL